MNFDLYITTLGPEVILAIGVCVAVLMGVARSHSVRAMVAPFALLVLALALACSASTGVPVSGSAQPPGIRVTSLTYYVRTIALLVGALILLVNWHLPAAGERGEFFGFVKDFRALAD